MVYYFYHAALLTDWPAMLTIRTVGCKYRNMDQGKTHSLNLTLFARKVKCFCHFPRSISLFALGFLTLCYQQHRWPCQSATSANRWLHRHWWLHNRGSKSKAEEAVPMSKSAKLNLRGKTGFPLKRCQVVRPCLGWESFQRRLNERGKTSSCLKAVFLIKCSVEEAPERKVVTKVLVP